MRLSMARSYGTWCARVERRAPNFLHIVVLMVALMTVWPAPSQAAPDGETKPIKLVVMGDSLSAGLGLPGQAAFPARLQ